MVGPKTLGSRFAWCYEWLRPDDGEHSLSQIAVPTNQGPSSSAAQGAIGFLFLVFVLGFFLIQVLLVVRKEVVLFDMILRVVVRVVSLFLVPVVVLRDGFLLSFLIMHLYPVRVLTLSDGLL